MSSNGFGPASLSFCELDSWLRYSERELSVSDKMLIKDLSDAYVAELNRASKHDAEPPYKPVFEEIEIDRPAVQNKLKAALRSFKRK